MALDMLGPLQFQLLAVLLEQPGNAYAVTIMQRVAARTGRSRSMPAIHAALDRLHERSMVSSWWGEPTAERGGRRKRYYKIEPAGIEAVRRTRITVQPFASPTTAEAPLAD